MLAYQQKREVTSNKYYFIFAQTCSDKLDMHQAYEQCTHTKEVHNEFHGLALVTYPINKTSLEILKNVEHVDIRKFV